MAIGLESDTLRRVLLTAVSIGVILAGRALIVAAVAATRRNHEKDKIVFWARQGSSLLAFLLCLVAAGFVWLGDGTRSTTVAGLATAGIAVAAQRVVTAFAGYLIIIRGKTFKVGDRISMGGVRGDVIQLAFLQTRILEIGQPREANDQDDTGVWIHDRQYSGRIVTITNDKVFDEPVYNFTRELPFIWEEISIPLSYRANRAKAEQILLDAANNATRDFIAQSQQPRELFEARYDVRLDQAVPKVYWRITNDWLDLTLRYLAPERGTREIKDAINRTIINEFDASGIELANTTIEVVFPGRS